MPSPPPSRWLLVSAALLVLDAGACGGAADSMDALTSPAGSTPEMIAPRGEPGPLPAAALRDPPLAPEAAPVPDAPVKKFIGTYRWTGGLPEQRALWLKIESIAGSFNFIARPIVRDRLAAGNMIAKEIRIDVDASMLFIHSDVRKVAAPLDGTGVKVKVSNGETMNMSFKVGAAEIEQRFEGSNKGRVNRYELEGARLIVHTRVHASQLPKELVYQLTYERVAD